MILYQMNLSPPVRAVLMTLEILGITDVEMVDVNLLARDHLKEDYVKMNPQHTIPLLRDNDFVIWDSHAITTYLVNKYADDHPIYPRDPQKRAIIDQRLHFDSGILFPAGRNTIVPVLFYGKKSFRPENLENIKKSYDIAEELLTTPWMAGENLTLADVCCGSSISSSKELLPIDSETYPKITAWLKKLASEDFYKKRNEPGLAYLRQVLKQKLQ